jgi:Uma2 family endonuclease
MHVDVSRRPFTVEEYHRMAAAGILGEDDRVELLEGEIVQMEPIGSRHAGCVNRITRIFVERAGGRAVVTVQNPITLGLHSEPQPDLVLARPRADDYANAHPGPGDILLIVEVAETSARYDREVRLPVYARFGLPEAWLVNLTNDRIEVYREPGPDGYGSVRHQRRGADLEVLAIAGLTSGVDEILG